MDQQLKHRLIFASIAFVIVVVLLVVFFASSASAKSVSVDDALSGQYQDKKIKVEGLVVDNSYEMKDSTLTFSIYDSEEPGATTLQVSYEGGLSSTFGNGVSAICTGKMGSDGVLYASELVTKCPSKYEDPSGALSVAQLLDYGDSVLDKPVKVVGTIVAGTMATEDIVKTFTICDADDPSAVLPVSYQGALSAEVKEGASIVITGSRGASGVLSATDISLEG